MKKLLILFCVLSLPAMAAEQGESLASRREKMLAPQGQNPPEQPQVRAADPNKQITITYGELMTLLQVTALQEQAKAILGKVQSQMQVDGAK